LPNDSQSDTSLLNLELEYERAARLYDNQWHDEFQRRLRVQILLLEDESKSLNDQIDQDDVRIEQLLAGKDIVEDERSAAMARFEELRSKYQSRVRELQQLRVSEERLSFESY
jgi:hypothetical protein